MDQGYFGPESVSWRVHRELTVLFGGARALLLQAAHPLVVAGANQTGMYDRNPWKRLQRTLILTYAITFGSRSEAHAAADRINDVHARVHGIDPVTGLPYDALDPDLLLYVHACLVDSALLFERLTVGGLDDRARQRFNEEQMLVAELCRVPHEIIPPTVAALRAWLAGVEASGILRVTDGARRVADLFRSPPADAEWRPVLPLIARLAFGTLPTSVRDQYDVPASWASRRRLALTFAAIRAIRPWLPPSIRFIEPYRNGLRLVRGSSVTEAASRVRRAVGIRLP